MSDRGNPIPWLVWSAAAILLIVSTRNPILLTLAAIAILIVRSSLRPSASSESLSWKFILRIGVVVAVISVAFNLLTVHVGSDVIGHLPDELPIVGGALTLNALVYGVAGGLALISLILVAATFAGAVDRGTLIRLLPSSFGSAGTATIVALSIFPQTLRAVSEVHEAQASRGFRIRSMHDLEPLLVPVLHLGLEHAFELAESVEARGFGNRTASAESPRAGTRFILPLGLTLATAGVIIAGLGHLVVGFLTLATAMVALLASSLRRRASRRSRYRPIVWTSSDLVCAGSAAVTSLLVLAALVLTANLQYSPYPDLDWPSVSVIPLIATLLLVVPTFISTGIEGV